MFYKKRLLLLTDKARLVYLDPNNMQPKGEISGRELAVAVKSDHAFTVKHGKDSYVMDTRGQRTVSGWSRSRRCRTSSTASGSAWFGLPFARPSLRPLYH